MMLSKRQLTASAGVSCLLLAIVLAEHHGILAPSSLAVAAVATLALGGYFVSFERLPFGALIALAGAPAALGLAAMRGGPAPLTQLAMIGSLVLAFGVALRVHFRDSEVTLVEAVSPIVAPAAVVAVLVFWGFAGSLPVLTGAGHAVLAALVACSLSMVLADRGAPRWSLAAGLLGQVAIYVATTLVASLTVRHTVAAGAALAMLTAGLLGRRDDAHPALLPVAIAAGLFVTTIATVYGAVGLERPLAVAWIYAVILAVTHMRSEEDDRQLLWTINTLIAGALLAVLAGAHPIWRGAPAADGHLWSLLGAGVAALLGWPAYRTTAHARVALVSFAAAATFAAVSTEVGLLLGYGVPLTVAWALFSAALVRIGPAPLRWAGAGVALLAILKLGVVDWVHITAGARVSVVFVAGAVLVFFSLSANNEADAADPGR